MSVFVRFTDNLSSDTDTARSLNGQDVFNKANGKGQQESQTTKRLQQRLLSALFFGGTSSISPTFLRFRCGSSFFLNQLTPRTTEELLDERCRINAATEIRILENGLLKGNRRKLIEEKA